MVGYDDQEHMAAFLDPPLTTVGLPHHAMGEAAATLLLDAIEKGAKPPGARPGETPLPGGQAWPSVGPAPSP